MARGAHLLALAAANNGTTGAQSCQCCRLMAIELIGNNSQHVSRHGIAAAKVTSSIAVAATMADGLAVYIDMARRAAPEAGKNARSV